MKHHVFVSYSSKDAHIAADIVEHLQGKGIPCWTDRGNLRFTRKYDEEIERAIRSSRVVLWLASRDSVASDYVKFEISTALNLKKPVGPVYLEPMDPARLPSPFNLKLANVQGVEFFSGSPEAGKQKLADELQSLLTAGRRSRVAAVAAVLLVCAAVLTVGMWMASLSGGQKKERGAPTAAQGLPRVAAEGMAPAATFLPERVARLPAAGVLSIAYGAAPPPAPEGAQQPELQIEVLVRRAGEVSFSALDDGNQLASLVDDYFIAARPSVVGYLYVFQIDSIGKRTWLFPRNETFAFSAGRNPVEAGTIVQVPSTDSDRVLYLDDATGIEHIYAVFSATLWPELEQALAGEPSKPPAGGAGTTPGALVVVAVEQPNGLQMRGIAGVRKAATSGAAAEAFTVERAAGGRIQSVSVPANTYRATGSFLVVERWFRHVSAR
jgi:hypothetical protein